MSKDWVNDGGWPWSAEARRFLSRRERFRLWAGMLAGRAMYRLGLTHQFRCKVCGWPTLEYPRENGWWIWYCPNCGWDHGGGHRPRVMKKQHRIVGWLRCFWRELRG